jgi:large subunit ribosomal protein L35
MPKIKSHSGAKKRFKITAGGKVKHKKAGLRHLLTDMSANRGRRLKKLEIVTGAKAKLIKTILPYR